MMMLFGFELWVYGLVVIAIVIAIVIVIVVRIVVRFFCDPVLPVPFVRTHLWSYDIFWGPNSEVIHILFLV